MCGNGSLADEVAVMDKFATGAEGGGSKLEQLLEFVPDAVVAVGKSGRIVGINQQAQALFGYGREAMIGAELEMLVPERFRDLHDEHRSAYFEAPRARSMGAGMELFGLRRDGSEFPLEISLSCFDWRGEAIAAAAVRDISPRAWPEPTGSRDAATSELQASLQEAVEYLAGAIEVHDPACRHHVKRVGSIAALLGAKLGLGGDRVRLLQAAATMHDVGKAATPDGVLRKRDRLTPAERERMEGHTTTGCELLAGAKSQLVKLAATIALTHHEWFDGSGYPRGLHGEKIPLEGRIVAVVDVLDALLSERPYRPAFSAEEARAVLASKRGTHLDPSVVDVLLDNFDEALASRGAA